MNYYAGIGSRETPAMIISFMEGAAKALYEKHSFILRSGGARGADSAFEKGCDSVCGTKEIFKAYDATSDAMELASKFHPAWGLCNKLARALHGRNMMILLGKDLQTPVDFIVCWTPGGSITGGTGQALRAALVYNIHVFNLYSAKDFQELRDKYVWK